MKAPSPPKPLRCAIYTRKSTEHNLDLAFNSLDAQREACEAYIKSEAHEGWTLLAHRYDDGGLSGASLDRPALQKLLAVIHASQVDIIVVYKVDRLTRSLADFAKLVEAFDANGVAFVSVTQSFNTTSSMGRLTLNVLLSFAQFEREVIGERVRDKIAASKRKGLWVGGPVPLGYRSVGKALTVVPEDAATVRTIFERYLVVGSIGSLIDDLYQRGISPSGRVGSSLPESGTRTRRFMVGPLGHILKNRFYVGDVVYKGDVHTGQHDPILDRETFAAVQEKLRTAAVTRSSQRSSTAPLLMGLLHDDQGHRMSPSHANKRGVRYRYYVSQAVLQNRTAEAGTVRRVAAPDIEALVVAAMLKHTNVTTPYAANAIPSLADAPSDRELITMQVQRVVIRVRSVEITLRDAKTNPTVTAAALINNVSPVVEGQQTSHQEQSPPHVLHVPWAPKPGPVRKGISHEPAVEARLDPQARTTLLTTIRKARAWIDDLVVGRTASFAEIAVGEGKGERHVRQLAPLAFVSPKIVAAIVAGTAPADLTVSALAKSLPHLWTEQEQRFGIT